MLPYKAFPAQGSEHLSLPLRLCSIDYHREPSVTNPYSFNVCQVIVGIKGRGVMRLHGEKEFVLKTGQAVIIKPGITHEFQKQDEAWETAAVWFDCNPFVLSQFRLRAHKPLDLHSSSRVMDLIERLQRHTQSEEGTALKTSEMIYSLLLEIKLQSESLQQKASYPVLTTQKVMDYIHKNYSRKLNLDEFSRVFGYTPQHLNRIFKKESGYSIYQYILKVQLEQAADMLGNEEFTVEQVADEVGMEWRSFYRLFQRKYQASPGEFRKHIKKTSS
ncbi:AraC family transcriptional regulator [Paenibacillus allorhizosphaerae]|uniref:HTH-type transcriptional activator RhaS n=1 Tax=Paenibacillus allorhizosphaerae TaxID=2849866 RepID=A0ABM8VIJ2_9BACL|nr:AraC family transcriptional regulator [Paenibacillus allorhizosphaerae]CAG7644045.1 HTH-type transcriptional activator RhaS [Paenibacillus allorhizosphaerae]